MVDNVLFLIQKIGKDKNDHAQCGVGIRGKLTSDILKQSKKYNFIQCYVDTIREVELYILQYHPTMIIYNFHGTTTKWVYDPTIIYMYPKIVHVMIHYDIVQWRVDTYAPDKFCQFNYVVTDDTTLRVNIPNFLTVPRSIPCDGLYINRKSLMIERVDDTEHIPKIGFQGFGFPHKGIDRMAMQVQKEFDEAIIRLHMPCSYYGDPAGAEANIRVQEVRSIITKPGIKLEVTNQFMDDEGIVNWLHENDVNCYFYHYQDGCGIASSPDYAIAAGKPIAITHSFQLRNLWNLSPSIEIEQNSLKTIMANGTRPLEPLYAKYSHASLVNGYENICDKLMGK
jgi:hypothetical protein